MGRPRDELLDRIAPSGDDEDWNSLSINRLGCACMVRDLGHGGGIRQNSDSEREHDQLKSF